MPRRPGSTREGAPPDAARRAGDGDLEAEVHACLRAMEAVTLRLRVQGTDRHEQVAEELGRAYTTLRHLALEARTADVPPPAVRDAGELGAASG